LSDDYRIVVVEKAGYGFSDVVDIDRDYDYYLEGIQILKETMSRLVDKEA